MHILITGAAGMVGRKLTARLAQDGAVGGQAITRLTLVDVVAPDAPAGFAGQVETRAADLSAPGEPRALHRRAAGPRSSTSPPSCRARRRRISRRATASISTARARCSRRSATAGGGYKPRVVFTSSIAVFGAPFPDAIGDEFFTTPLTSYGTQKAIGELLLADYSRRGFLDGIGIRLPTICIRPGKPNKAASGFFSNILREPLAGHEAVLPVDEDVRHWHASPRAAVGFLMHAATLDLAPLGARRTLSMPGLSATVGEQIEALRRAAGESAVKLIRRERDPAIEKIVAGWPRNFDTQARGIARLPRRALLRRDHPRPCRGRAGRKDP